MIHPYESDFSSLAKSTSQGDPKKIGDRTWTSSSFLFFFGTKDYAVHQLPSTGHLQRLQRLVLSYPPVPKSHPKTIQKPSKPKPPIAVESCFFFAAILVSTLGPSLKTLCVENGPFVDHAPLKHGDVPAMSNSQLG